MAKLKKQYQHVLVYRHELYHTIYSRVQITEYRTALLTRLQVFKVTGERR